MRPDKTVFITGAGFSKPLDAPIQSEIMAEIFKLNNKKFYDDRRVVHDYLKEFKSFLANDLYFDPDNFGDIALEDVFTPIDRCILDGVSFRSYDLKKLVDLREKIYSLIIIAIAEKLQSASSRKSYVDVFARYLVSQMQPRINNIKYDPVSVISTNWDIILDNSIKEAIEENAENGVVDYCCHVSSFQNDDTIKPGLWALGKGGYNVKLIKLHGSMNWLQCPKCSRLYVAFFDKIAEYGIYKTQSCRHCLKNFETDTEANALRSNLIMPTFLKDFNNFQIKLSWQSAASELSEAKRIVFIGYSLPHADFELRQLLSRMVRHEAVIEVVLRPEENDSHKIENELTIQRYKNFFGKRKIVPYPIGVIDFIAKLTS